MDRLIQLHQNILTLYKEYIYKDLCKDGALIVLDDIRMNDMYGFWEELAYPKLEITADCHESGFGVFLYHE
jgi:hypothetical protein